MARLAVARAAMTDRTLDLVVERMTKALFVEELARVVAETSSAESSNSRSR
jgi:hypothetical protein